VEGISEGETAGVRKQSLSVCAELVEAPFFRPFDKLRTNDDE
jgi:hypothetical protein